MGVRVAARRNLVVAVLTVTAVAAVSGGAAAVGARSSPRDTITRVTGTAPTGFHVHYRDRATAYLPTRSEALAECAGYHRRLRRVRCRVVIRTRYHDLGDTKRAIRYARHR